MKADLPNSYFEELNYVLKKKHHAVPVLLIDLDIVDQNIEAFKRDFTLSRNYRIVVKSLPSPELIEYILGKMNSKDLMVFHQPFLTDLTRTLNDKADVLLGKPMPFKTARYYYMNLPVIENGFNPYNQIQWLVDTESRILEYINLADTLQKKLRLNFEIDVGLRRGGFQNLNELHNALKLVKKHQEKIAFSGFMGYDPHVVKIPSFLSSQKGSLNKSNSFYIKCKKHLKEEFPEMWHDGLTFNGAGSPTISLHNNNYSPLNDLSAGSCFVKPSTFDIPSLSNYKPACFIATPVLKKMSGTTIPGIEQLKPILKLFNTRNAQSFFIYAGFWKADYVFPKKIKQNKLYGESTNQTMINAPASVNLEVDDCVFLRPHQSEFVFLQFGKLLIIRSGKILDRWSLLKNE